MAQHPPGVLALACSEVARYSATHASIAGLLRPAGSRYCQMSSLSVAANFNAAAELFLDDPAMAWMFLMNDDHIYPDDTLIRLLDRDVDAVTGLYLDRSSNPTTSPIPFPPVLFDRVHQSGHVSRRFLAPDESGLIPIVACGDGAMLVRRRVFEAITPPWWTFGEVEASNCNHDLSFCRRIREAGFQIYADLDVPVGHIQPMAITPRRVESGNWVTVLTGKGPQEIMVQAAILPEGTE
jgi:hypothetical protein